MGFPLLKAITKMFIDELVRLAMLIRKPNFWPF
jgi:hypothetical protein